MQAEISLVIDHIDSVPRPSLNGRTPYELGQTFVPSKLFEVMELKVIPSNKFSQ